MFVEGMRGLFDTKGRTFDFIFVFFSWSLYKLPKLLYFTWLLNDLIFLSKNRMVTAWKTNTNIMDCSGSFLRSVHWAAHSSQLLLILFDPLHKSNYQDLLKWCNTNYTINSCPIGQSQHSIKHRVLWLALSSCRYKWITKQ